MAKVAVVVQQKSSFNFKATFTSSALIVLYAAVTFPLLLFLAPSPRLIAQESLDEVTRKGLFKDSLTPGCVKIVAPPAGNIDVTPTLNRFVAELVKEFNEKKAKELAARFHPRLKFSKDQLTEILQKLTSTYGPKLTVSVYRMWALNTADGSPFDITCTDPDIKLTPLYGYNLQFALWVQVMGSEEISRIYLPIVFAQGQWFLGGYHSQQWTHRQKDYLGWAQKSEESMRMEMPLAAFIELDLAEKLGNGHRFFGLVNHLPIIQRKANLMSSADFASKIKSIFPDQPIEHVSPLFVPGGSGLLVRIRIPKELSLEQIKSTCNAMKEQFKKQKWSSQVASMRCSFLLPKEDPQQEGALGGVLVDL